MRVTVDVTMGDDVAVAWCIVYPAEKATATYPGCPSYAEVETVTINGRDVDLASVDVEEIEAEAVYLAAEKSRYLREQIEARREG